MRISQGQNDRLKGKLFLEERSTAATSGQKVGGSLSPVNKSNGSANATPLRSGNGYLWIGQWSAMSWDGSIMDL